MKKLAIFDLGQVCVRIHVDRCFEHWKKLSGEDVLDETRFDDASHDKYERGEIGAGELWTALRRSMGLGLSDEEWLKGWNSIFGEVIEETRSTVAKMKEAGLRVVVLSNTNREHVEIWMPMYQHFMDMFDCVYVSNELGARKPERRIYERVLELENVEGRECVFFDDKIENIAAANLLGIEGVHFVADSVAAEWWAKNG